MADSLPSGYRAPGPPPKDALDYFRKKGFKIGFDYRDVWREEHVVAFTVAKAMEYDLLVMIRQAVDDALAKGVPFEKFAKELQPLLEEKGWWGKKTMIDPVTGEEVEVQLGSPRRLRTIFDTNLRSAYNAGQWDRIQRTKRSLPYVLRTVGPSREHRPQHLAWHGTLLKADDPWWKTHWAPDAWGCKCRQRQISKYEYQRLVKEGVQPPLGDDTAIKDERGRLTGQQRAKKVPAQTTPPPAKMVEWTNKRTGETIQIEEGFDPGFDYNPGLERQTYLKKLLDEKAAVFDEAMSDSSQT